MNDLNLPSNLLDKLGHNILEIRERALLTLVSKINNGIAFENDISNSKKMLTKLFEWFLFNPCPHECMVLTLIKKILLSKSGPLLMNHYGPNTIKNELKQVKAVSEPVLHSNIDELIEIVEKASVEPEIFSVPPLVTDVPLSYRSENGSKSSRSNIHSTATSFGGFISESTYVDQKMANEDICPSRPTYRVDQDINSTSEKNHDIEIVLPNNYFQWQPLIHTDQHVLNSVENTLKNSSKPTELLDSCDFFMNVLLSDFPGEVFLQRSNIVLLLKDLLQTSASTRICAVILNCFSKLTRVLLKRIDYCNDPCMHCVKEYTKSITEFYLEDPGKSVCSEFLQLKEDMKSLKQHEISSLKYCTIILQCILDYLIIKPESLQDTARKKHVNSYLALTVIQKLLYLTKSCFSCNIWKVQPHGIIYDILKDINRCLKSFGDLITNFRIEINSSETNAKFRAVELCILHNCMYFLESCVPIDCSAQILPNCLKNALVLSLLDIPIAKLYPELHSKMLKYVHAFTNSDSESLSKFDMITKVCDSMSAAVKFMRYHDSLCFLELMDLARNGILSLQFHENLEFVKSVVETCATKFSLFMKDEDAAKMEEVILRLLSYNVEEVVEYTYKLCYKKVIAAIGPMLNLSQTGVSSAQVVFLLRHKIFVEIAQYGLCNKNLQVKKYAEDIMIHLIKCKILVTDEIWNKVREALIPSFPILLLYCSKLTPLGRTLINVVDPDIAKDLRFSNIDVLKSNVLLLYSPEGLVRDEAFSRLCWLLAVQENSKNLLPRLNNMNDKTLPNVCQIHPKGYDVNKLRTSERFYEPSSLNHVMELLKSPNVEPGIRRSALTQIAVMMDDYLLHDIFLDRGGVDLVIEIMNKALVENDYINYADSVIPAITILKNICLFRTNIRYELSLNLNFYQCVLRGLFLFCSDERMKVDASILLFLLLYSSFIQGSPSRCNIAIPKLVNDKLVTPIICQLYGETSDFTCDNLTEVLFSERSCLSSLQIHWNSEVYGGFKNLIHLENIPEPSDIHIPDRLRIKTRDLDQIKVSSVYFSIEQCLKEIQVGESSTTTEELIHALMIYLHLFKLGLKEKYETILIYPWEENFGKFLRILPSSEEDASLLLSVIKFLRILLPFYIVSEKDNWITSIIKDPTHYITDLLSTAASREEHLKVLSRELIGLITDCVCQEHHFTDLCIENEEKLNPISSWANVLEMVIGNLKLHDSKQLYNLAYLDSSLLCLVHLSSMIGWSNSQRKHTSTQTIKDLISGLCDLIDAFHYSKGPTAAISLMGLSITRNVLLILNHILAEVHISKMKNWDLLFIEDLSEENKISNFVVLWKTRDIVLKAAVLQFFAGLVKSTRLSRDIISDLKMNQKCFWSLTLSILLDSDEASIVRENAALILANLCTHIKANNQNINDELIPLGYDRQSYSNTADIILDLLEQKTFVEKIKTLILCLYTNNITEQLIISEKPRSKSSAYLYTYRTSSELSERSWMPNNIQSKERLNIATPSLIKATVAFLHNLSECAGQSFVDYLNEVGLIKLVFRSLCYPSIEVNNTKQLSLYSELLELNSEICFFLNRVVRFSPGCLGTVLHTKDCMNVLISLLDPEIYRTYLPQLFYLKNKLLREVFSLIGAFLECGLQVEEPSRAFEILAIVLEIVCNNPTKLLSTICEALSNIGAFGLQSAVLITLTLMLQIEYSHKIVDENHEIKNVILINCSMQTLLDTMKVPIHIALQNNEQNHENTMSKYKIDLLEKIYFGEVKSKSKPRKLGEANKNMEAGAEICKLLLHLYDIYNIKIGEDNTEKQVILAATSSLLCLSSTAKYYALDICFLQKILQSLKEISIKLSLESVDYFRRVTDKKRIAPLLKDLDSISGLLTNFLLGNVSVKCEAASLGLADIIHKLWNWFALQKVTTVNILKLLSTFTTNCPFACQTLPYTCPLVGTGPRKTASNLSLLNVIISMICKEMDMISKSHDMLPLKLCFNILQNCSSVLECRIAITKSNLLQGMLKLHPAMTKRQKPWENVELSWLDFLQVFTVYPEGQMFIGKLPEILDLIITLTQNTKTQNRIGALIVLQNIAFYTLNRARLLTTPNFINTLVAKLESGCSREKVIVVNTMWALVANNMKAKTVFKAARLDYKLSETLKKIQLLSDDALSEEEIDRMKYVLDILRTDDRCK